MRAYWEIPGLEIKLGSQNIPEESKPIFFTVVLWMCLFGHQKLSLTSGEHPYLQFSPSQPHQGSPRVMKTEPNISVVEQHGC